MFSLASFVECPFVFVKTLDITLCLASLRSLRDFDLLHVQYNSSSCKHENRLNKEYFAFPWPWKTVLSCAVHAHLSSGLAVAPLFNVTEESWGLFLLAPRYALH